MNLTINKLLTILFALICIIFGIDKFVELLPTCSLTNHISQRGLMITGIIEIIVGITLLLKIKELLSLRIATALMIGGLLMHLVKGAYDFSGALIGGITGLYLIYSIKKQKKELA